MSPPPGPENQAFGVDDLRRAVAIYLSVAYAGNDPPEAVKRRLAWAEGLQVCDVVAKPPFEKAGKDRNDLVHALRLGNHRYPHMKLQVQPWPTSSGIMLSVNTHDQVLSLTPTADDADAFRSLQAENARIKEAIEQQWNAAGLPTFLRYLRDYLQEHPAESR